LASCTLGVKGIKLSEDELFEIAQKQIKDDLQGSFKALFREDKFIRTIKTLERLLEDYPESKYSRISQLLIADLHYVKGGDNLIDAEMEYESYVKRYPLSEDTPRAHYRLGMSILRQFLDWDAELTLLDQLDRVDIEKSKRDKFRDKDLSLLIKASKVFAEVVNLYPGTIYHDIALRYLQTATYILSIQDLYVAKFYLKQNENISAYKRLDHILRNYPSPLIENEVKFLLSKCLWNLKFKKEALSILNQLRSKNLDKKLGKKVAKTLKKYTKQAQLQKGDVKWLY